MDAVDVICEAAISLAGTVVPAFGSAGALGRGVVFFVVVFFTGAFFAGVFRVVPAVLRAGSRRVSSANGRVSVLSPAWSRRVDARGGVVDWPVVVRVVAFLAGGRRVAVLVVVLVALRGAASVADFVAVLAVGRAGARREVLTGVGSPVAAVTVFSTPLSDWAAATFFAVTFFAGAFVAGAAVRVDAWRGVVVRGVLVRGVVLRGVLLRAGAGRSAWSAAGSGEDDAVFRGRELAAPVVRVAAGVGEGPAELVMSAMLSLSWSRARCPGPGGVRSRAFVVIGQSAGRGRKPTCTAWFGVRRPQLQSFRTSGCACG
ncbi:hypothetical protein JCM9957A_24760 [Kineosporia succinea]